jgi:Tol biopolymer transport system component
VGKRLTVGQEEDYGAVLSPDRRTIVYVHELEQGGPTELRRMAVDGSHDEPLFEHEMTGCTKPGRPAWDPKEFTLLVIPCGDDQSSAHLRLVSIDGVTVRPLPITDRARIEDVTFSPGGTEVAFWGGSRTSGQGAIFTQFIDGHSEAEQITKSGRDNGVAWSPDGELLAFSRGNDNGGREIFVKAPEADAEEKQLTTAGGVNEGPAWSPDGTMIAYSSDRQTADPSVQGEHWWVMTADGDDQQALETGGRSYDTPAWGPAAVT